ncbi:MAG: acyloxyacyl hydrolase [Saprospiraceae bacterium]
MIYTSEKTSGFLLKKVTTIFSLCLFIGSLQGQPLLKGWSIEPNVHIGQIVKHSPKLLFDVDGLATAVELNFSHQTFGKKEWNQFQRYPQMNLSLVYQDLGSDAIFGEAISLIPNVNSSIYSSNKFSLGFRFGIGLAYLTKPFDPIDNPTNNAVGSNWNAGVLFDLNSRWRINDHWQLKTGVSFLHYSNGSSHLPNFGFNVPSLVLGARYTPVALPKSAYTNYDVSKKQNRKWGAQAWASITYRERGVSGGPSYPIYSVSVAAIYYLNKVNRLSAGVEYEYNKSVYEFGKHVSAFDSEEEARRRSQRYLFFLADEFLFGNWGVTLMAGMYASNEYYLLPGNIYNKVITRYYFPTKTKVKIHVGAYLKSHLIIAEYMAFGLGASF